LTTAVYLAEAFCRQCTPTALFNIFFWLAGGQHRYRWAKSAVFFWLGYCNSAANPFIYGLCSKDFRYAFQKFLRCRYKRTKPALRHSANARRQQPSPIARCCPPVRHSANTQMAQIIPHAPSQVRAHCRRRRTRGIQPQRRRTTVHDTDSCSQHCLVLEQTSGS